MGRPQNDATTGSGELIDLRGVSRHYEIGGGTVKALDEVDLRVGPGEFVVILGASGSGKTTLLNVIGALDSPTAGTAVVGGRDITRASRRELFALRRHRIGFIFQSFNLFPGLTAFENVQFGADVAGRADAAGRPLSTSSIGSASPTAAVTSPMSCPAASSSGWRSRERWRPATRSSSPTNLPVSSTSRPESDPRAAAWRHP